ncbi:hypothetical protein IMY05_C4386000400 [Salix suchowensis]|nr:hypothetical protein IMY05_C4386000400 [Salix suchowensis]
MAREKKARHKFQMSSAKENMLPRLGSTHTHTVAVSGNLRRVRETPRVMRSAGEACSAGDLDETALQYIDPELVRRKRYAASNAPMLEWWPYRMEYLMESMRAEGRGRQLHGKSVRRAQRRSQNREGLTLVGQKWNGEYFECTTLQALGLRIQLGHLKGECVNPERVPVLSLCFIRTEYIWSTSTFVAAISMSATGSNSFKVDGRPMEDWTRIRLKVYRRMPSDKRNQRYTSRAIYELCSNRLHPSRKTPLPHVPEANAL